MGAQENRLGAGGCIGSWDRGVHRIDLDSSGLHRGVGVRDVNGISNDSNQLNRQCSGNVAIEFPVPG